MTRAGEFQTRPYAREPAADGAMRAGRGGFENPPLHRKPAADGAMRTGLKPARPPGNQRPTAPARTTYLSSQTSRNEYWLAFG